MPVGTPNTNRLYFFLQYETFFPFFQPPFSRIQSLFPQPLVLRIIEA